MAPIWAQHVASILAFDPPNGSNIADQNPLKITIARLSFNITHKMAKFGPRIAPIWLPGSQLLRPKKHSCSFHAVPQLTTSPQALQFLEPNYIYLLTNFPWITLKGNLCVQNPAVRAAVDAKRQEYAKDVPLHFCLSPSHCKVAPGAGGTAHNTSNRAARHVPK